MEALLLPLLLVAVFYLLLIRPQQRQRRQMADVQASLIPGSQVMTGAGLFATVKTVEDDRIELEVAPGITNWYLRRAIVQVIPDRPDIAEPGATFNESTGEHNRGSDNDNPDGGTR